METAHDIHIGDARALDAVPSDSVELVVTSPPYPMIEMWDEIFATLSPRVETALNNEDGAAAFDAMHAVLDEVWDEIERVLVPGGIACINIGDATRTITGNFRVYQNHARIMDAFTDRGFSPLPEILWRKPTNSAAKFMGSGMTPPNAYVTLEHEYILCFRNGDTRRGFEPGAENRYESAYFQEERNKWFSDLWEDVRGKCQPLNRDELRDRSAAYPVEIPYRLINMYSVYGDTVLDPFWGTGTTTLAAMLAARDSIGCELHDEFLTVFEDRVSNVPEIADAIITQRLSDHREYIEDQIDDGQTFAYEADIYEVPVASQDERQIQLYTAEQIEQGDDDKNTAANSSTYTVRHTAVTDSEAVNTPSKLKKTTLSDF
ncbi:DNA-methyltransferase [Salinibaculum rarum]|uniref:DNA-methyltransferase n=1 Tax=Salinibaculum rarum TaxID=3058903 RepID=UPI00265D973B|nr:site-specific DNA-methyltransferase [Salinibaculum sp. KK48]